MVEVMAAVMEAAVRVEAATEVAKAVAGKVAEAQEVVMVAVAMAAVGQEAETAVERVAAVTEVEVMVAERAEGETAAATAEHHCSRRRNSELRDAPRADRTCNWLCYHQRRQRDAHLRPQRARKSTASLG